MDNRTVVYKQLTNLTNRSKVIQFLFCLLGKVEQGIKVTLLNLNFWLYVKYMKLLHLLSIVKHLALRQWHQDIINAAISSPLVTLHVCTCPWSKPLIYYSLHLLLGFKLLGTGFGLAVFNYFSNFNINYCTYFPLVEVFMTLLAV